jgi:hypothetical protein
MDSDAEVKPKPLGPSEFRQALKIGPDGNDLLTCRPYFLIDVDQSDCGAESARIIRFLKGVRDSSNPNAPYRPVTDIYISSHGWHRNLFRGVSAYNRLASRLSILFRRGRLRSYVDLSTYSPLHVNLHWNSDVDIDDWVDLDGRKRRDDFLQATVSEFQAIDNTGSQADLINLMEDVYQYFTTTSAPDINPLEPRLQDQSSVLFERLKHYQIVQAPGATMPERVAVLWTKYHEATHLGSTQEQLDKPRSYATSRERILRASSFLLRIFIPVVGLSALLDPFKSLFDLPIIKQWLKQPTINKVFESLVVYTVLYFLSWALLLHVARSNKKARIEREATRVAPQDQELRTPVPSKPKRTKVARPLDVPSLLAWSIMQVAHLVPVLAYCLLTYPSIIGLGISWAVVLGVVTFFSMHMPADRLLFQATTVIALVGWVILCWTQWYSTNVSFDERAGKRGQKPDEDKLKTVEFGLRARFISGFASYPSQLAHEADVPYSRAYGLWDTVRSQLAIVRMQMRAVSRAPRAKDVICQLVRAAKDDGGLFKEDVRIHLFGHSFGGLLVVNLAKHLAYESVPVHTVCTLQGAYASDWFVGEDATLNNVTGWVAAIYTQYDTATGAMYSLANAGRNACGNIGLSSTRDNPLGKDRSMPVATYAPLPNASLSEPPDIFERLALTGMKLAEREPNSHCPVLNIDCSRFMSEGPVATGGAHDDIFKSDTIHMLWSVAHQSIPSAPLAPKAVSDLRFAVSSSQKQE